MAVVSLKSRPSIKGSHKNSQSEESLGKTPLEGNVVGDVKGLKRNRFPGEKSFPLFFFFFSKVLDIPCSFGRQILERSKG